MNMKLQERRIRVLVVREDKDDGNHGKRA